jgi:hypothetical protein
MDLKRHIGHMRSEPARACFGLGERAAASGASKDQDDDVFPSSRQPHGRRKSCPEVAIRLLISQLFAGYDEG